MKTGSKRKTNYSPVRQMNQTSSQANNRDFSQSELQDGIINPQAFHQFDFRLEEQPPKEVYIYNCCGVSKELNPAIEFMPTFRALFFLFNFLVFVFGLANFGMGLWFRIDPKVYEIHKYIETQNFTIAGWILLFCGFVTCLIALIGFVSAAKQAAGLLLCYFSIMIVLTLAFVATLVLLTVYGLGSSLEQFVTKEIYEQIRRRSVNTESDLFLSGDAAQFMDFVQVKMRCCGAVDFRDYGKLGMVVPTTCYTIDKNYISAPGCGRAIRQLFDLRAGLAAGFTLGSVITQLSTTILSALMFCSIYHWRANKKPLSPTLDTSSPGNSPSHLHLHQGPRSRTPIVI